MVQYIVRAVMYSTSSRGHLRIAASPLPLGRTTGPCDRLRAVLDS